MDKQIRKTGIIFSLLIVAAAGPAAAQRKADLSRPVVLGDSLSAGYQNGSLMSTQQVNGYANQIAQQARVNLVLPLVGAPGIPNALTLVSAGPPPQMTPLLGASLGRINPTEQVTNLAVPGAYIADLLTTRPDFNFQDMTDLVLGLPAVFTGQSKSQVEWAEALAPTTIVLWAGNMDVLNAATSGDPALVTPLAQFQAAYRAVADRLAVTGAKLVFANIPDVTTVPYLTSAENTAAMIGAPLAIIGPPLGIGPGDYVTPDAFSLIPAISTGSAQGPLPAEFVLTAAEASEVQAAVRAFNDFIAAMAREKGAALVDINALTRRISVQGYVVGGQRLTTLFLGGMFSLDGVHPTNTGYAIIANEFITALNTHFAAGVPPIAIQQVKVSDPLVLPGVGHPAHVDAATARSLRAMFARK
jgi:phospholipase/lecithinase/hemolysin